MKITGGQVRGLRLAVQVGDRTRPTTDRVRESLFGILRELLPGARVLDLFAGFGGLGFEAASRGAAEVTWVEQRREAVACIQESLERVRKGGLEQPLTPVQMEVERWLKHLTGFGADLIFADPPYKHLEGEGLPKLLKSIAESCALADEGLLLIECSGYLKEPEFPQGWSQLRREDYGSSSILFLEYNAEME